MLSDTTRSQIEDLIKKHKVVLFMKGSRSFPQCGFSATVATILNSYVPKYETVNVLASPDIRDGIKEYSSWPTIPQLYIDGKFVGGCDIVKEMHQTGELAKVLGVDGFRRRRDVATGSREGPAHEGRAAARRHDGRGPRGDLWSPRRTRAAIPSASRSGPVTTTISSSTRSRPVTWSSRRPESKSSSTRRALRGRASCRSRWWRGKAFASRARKRRRA